MSIASNIRKLFGFKKRKTYVYYVVYYNNNERVVHTHESKAYTDNFLGRYWLFLKLQSELLYYAKGLPMEYIKEIIVTSDYDHTKEIYYVVPKLGIDIGNFFKDGY